MVAMLSPAIEVGTEEGTHKGRPNLFLPVREKGPPASRGASAFRLIE